MRAYKAIRDGPFYFFFAVEVGRKVGGNFSD